MSIICTLCRMSFTFSYSSSALDQLLSTGFLTKRGVNRALKNYFCLLSHLCSSLCRTFSLDLVGVMHSS